MVRSSSTIITYLLFISAAALTTTKQIEGGKAESELQKKWFEDGNGRFKWSFGCSFPTKGLFALDVSKMKRNQSSTCPNLCYGDNRCTHFVFTNGYCYLKSLKFVDASPKAAIYNNSRGLCGFLVERPNVVKEWKVGNNGRTRWSNGCEYPNTKYNMYSSSKFMITDWSKCGTHCLSIKNCTHFGVKIGMCWVKNMRGAPVVQTIDKSSQICGFVPERQGSVKRRTRPTISPKGNGTLKNNNTITTPRLSFDLSTVNQQQHSSPKANRNITLTPQKTAISKTTQMKPTTKTETSKRNP